MYCQEVKREVVLVRLPKGFEGGEGLGFGVVVISGDERVRASSLDLGEGNLPLA